MQNNKAEDILSALLSDAKAFGADAADAIMIEAVSASVSCRMGKLEDVERAEGADLGLRVMVGRRQATVSTTDLSRPGLKDLAERCAAMAKAAPEDPYCGLAPAKRLAQPPFGDLDLGDFAEPSTDALEARARACEAAALAVKGVTNSSGAGASYSEGRKWFATSHGFFGEGAGAKHAISVSVLAQDENGMERDYDYDAKTHFDDLTPAEDIGRSAGERAVARLSPRRLKSRTAPVLFDNRLTSSLIGHLAGAANGGAVARGVSFVKDRLGEALFPASVSIVDDPHIRRGAGSCAFDGEGVANSRIDLVKDGVLTSWLMNSAHARQLGLETNARASRGVGGAPGAGSTNLYMQAGEQSPQELMAAAGEGLLLTDMFGPQINPNTGDYSVGCSGFWFENGAVAYPVSEITIAGALLEMYAGIVPANDLVFRGATNAPSIMVAAMTIAGD